MPGILDCSADKPDSVLTDRFLRNYGLKVRYYRIAERREIHSV